jgi:hypothetical protein
MCYRLCQYRICGDNAALAEPAGHSKWNFFNRSPTMGQTAAGGIRVGERCICTKEERAILFRFVRMFVSCDDVSAKNCLLGMRPVPNVIRHAVHITQLNICKIWQFAETGNFGCFDQEMLDYRKKPVKMSSGGSVVTVCASYKCLRAKMGRISC